MSFSKFGNYRYTLRDSARRGLSRNTAMLQRIAKEKTPENFCPVASCLYRTCTGNKHGNYTPCPKHIAIRFPECTCTNNGGYCDRCNALVELREQLPYGGPALLATLRAMGCPDMSGNHTREDIARAMDEGLDVWECFG